MARYILIIPTHRPNYLKNLLLSITKQKIYPDKIYIINDYHYNTKNNLNLINNIIIDNFPNLEIVEIIDSTSLFGSGAINAFKNCFKIAEFDYNSNLHNKEVSYYHIMEDDTEFLRTKAIKCYKELLDSNIDFIYSPLVDMMGNKVINGDLIINKPAFIPDSIPDTILDTCSIIFNGKYLHEFNHYLKDKEYVLNGDMYFYVWFLLNSKNPLQINETFIKSNIHDNQITSNLYLQTLNSGYYWYIDFIKLIGNLSKKESKLLKQLKTENRLMINYSIRAIINYHKIKIPVDIPSTKPPISTLKKILSYHKQGIINCEFGYVSFLRSNINIIRWLLNINIDNNQIDYHPNLKFLSEI